MTHRCKRLINWVPHDYTLESITKQQAQFYDRLLQCLNKTFYTNLKTQELYLDLARNTRKLRFKSIKTIYTTLTEGKADEVIFHKDKPNLLAFQGHNQLKTQRTCWRLIQKLITKIAYFLTNERGLKELAPTILKAVSFTRKATDKINTKVSFLQFFSEVIDLLIEENNILEKKIYNILIQRGYIYSADEFYRLSRFQNNADYTYTIGKRQNTEDLSEIVQQSPIAKSVPLHELAAKSKTRRGTFSTNKFFKNRTSVFYHLSDSNRPSQEDERSQKSQIDIKNISQKAASSINSIQPEQQQCLQKTNKLNHEVHQQVGKVIEEFIHHPNYQVFLQSIRQQTKSPESPKRTVRQPVIKQIIKNIRLKKFKANHQLLQINQEHLREPGSQKNQSQTKLKQPLKRSLKKDREIYFKQRTSIATALSKRVKQNLFKSTGLYDVQELIINNLVSFNKPNAEKKETSESKQSQQNILRHKKRLQTQNIQLRPASILHQQQQRKSSNLHFLSNAFVFKTGQKKSNLYAHYRTKTFGADFNYGSISSLESYSSVFSQKHTDSIKSQFVKNRQQKEPHLVPSQKNHILSKFARSSKLRAIKRGDNSKKQFNTAFLQFAAKKYNRYSTEENMLTIGENLQHLINLNSVCDDGILYFSRDKQNPKQSASPKDTLKESNTKSVFHKKRYEIFDRRNNRIL